MKVMCLGYWSKKEDDWIDCAFEETVRSYEQIHDNPNWMDFSPAQRLTDGTLAVFSQCILCAEEEEDAL